MGKQEVLDGLTRLLGEAKIAEKYYSHMRVFGEDIEVLEKAIEIIDKCIPVLKCKGAAHEDLIELVYPTGTGERAHG